MVQLIVGGHQQKSIKIIFVHAHDLLFSFEWTTKTQQLRDYYQFTELVVHVPFYDFWNGWSWWDSQVACSTFYSSVTSSVFDSFVTSCSRLPLMGLAEGFWIQLWKSSATNSRGVQVEKSALGIHFLFMGVSSVIGKIETTSELSGRPEPEAESDFVSWWTAALAIPYPIMPGVLPRAGFAPVRVKTPPSFRNCDAIEAEIVDDQTLCLIIKSVFFARSFVAFPPAHPPATQITASSLLSLSAAFTFSITSVSWATKSASRLTRIFASATSFSAKSILPTH